MTTAYLALGSNLGDRAVNLARACDLLAQRGIVIEARSRLYETQSVENGGDGDFLNGALRIGTNLGALDLLRVTQQIELDLGRQAENRAGARTIDIDILLFGTETVQTQGLHIPHPRMMRRAFVLRPLCDVLQGGWVAESGETW